MASKQKKTIQDLYNYCKKLKLIDPENDAHITDTHKFINQTVSQHIWGYQILTRPNDKNGNAFSAIVCYDSNGNILLVFSCYNSRPNCIRYLRYRPVGGTSVEQVPQLPSYNLSPSEYNAVIKLAEDEDKLYYMN
jgi:hypothetical protein